MTNVYTRKYKNPRSVTLLDYRELDVDTRSTGRVLSPTRLGNPHPLGLHQQPTSRATYFIWNPNFPRIVSRYREMLHHMAQVNFSCKYDEKLQHASRRGDVPTIAYTENTVSRQSYIDPARLPGLMLKDKPTGRFGYSQNKKAPTGIVPNLIVPQYMPVIDH